MQFKYIKLLQHPFCCGGISFSPQCKWVLGEVLVLHYYSLLISADEMTFSFYHRFHLNELGACKISGIYINSVGREQDKGASDFLNAISIHQKEVWLRPKVYIHLIDIQTQLAHNSI